MDHLSTHVPALAKHCAHTVGAKGLAGVVASTTKEAGSSARVLANFCTEILEAVSKAALPGSKGADSPRPAGTNRGLHQVRGVAHLHVAVRELARHAFAAAAGLVKLAEAGLREHLAPPALAIWSLAIMVLICATRARMRRVRALDHLQHVAATNLLQMRLVEVVAVEGSIAGTARLVVGEHRCGEGLEAALLGRDFVDLLTRVESFIPCRKRLVLVLACVRLCERRRGVRPRRRCGFRRRA
mmetsp:Transcript_56439/g.183371  ORF Transcript_56439/g.183371 Transcript_56439/m.183371 type:complete len:242 (-) Transcript_56439:318-1043(-)